MTPHTPEGTVVEIRSILSCVYPDMREAVEKDLRRIMALRPDSSGDGEAWSLVRRILEQGAAIQQDYAAGKYESYEHYAARIDEAARERADTLRNLPLPTLPAAEGWVSVEERLPEASGHYLGCLLTHGSSTVFFEDGEWKDCFGYEDEPVTHWQPLPAPPAAGDL